MPDDNIQYNITGWGRVAIWLKTYRDNSISCLILSGEGLGPGECGVKVKGGKLYQGNITEEVIKQIKRTVVPNGDVVISSCCSGNSPEAVEQLVGKLDRDVSVTTGCVRAFWPRIGFPNQGGYSPDGWIRYCHDFPQGWPWKPEDKKP